MKLFNLLIFVVGLNAAQADPINLDEFSNTVTVTTEFQAAAGDQSTPGTLVAPFPTIQNISVDWPVTNDNNNNGVVSIRYRKQGATAWITGMPLRLVPAGTNLSFSWAKRHSGSIFNLESNSTYQIEASLADPDGGSVVRTITAKTRAVPAAVVGAPVRAATPANLNSVLASARPGDIVLLGAGTYSGFQVPVSGTAGNPIVIRGGTGVQINGEIGVFTKSHIYLHGLNITGRIRFNGSHNISIVRCNIKASSSFGGDTIVTYLRSENSYISDNTLTGLTVWKESSFSTSGDNIGEGVVVTGPGHVIMNNRVSGFRDGLSLLEDSEAVDQYSIDILNNDISETADDGIEADFCFRNCRIMRNRITNTFIALSAQPTLGGPNYFIRNVVYNVAHIAFKLYRSSAGDVVLHNTIVKGGDGFSSTPGVPINNLYSRNNLFLGGPGATYNGYSSGSGQVMNLTTVNVANSKLDYDAFGTTTGAFAGRLGSISFSSLAQMRSLTSEKNGIQVGFDVFSTPVAYPANAVTKYGRVDLRIKSGAAVENKAVLIPNVNSSFSGTGPDIGAYETGATLPVYGPR